VAGVPLAIGRLLSQLVRIPRRVGRAISGFWFGRSLGFRRRSALVLLILALYAVIRFVSLPGVPCQLSPAEECPPSDDAVALVADDAFLYAHVNLDHDSSQFSKAEDLADKIPHFEAIGQGTFEALDISPRVDLRRDIGSWIGDEAAFAILPVGPRGQTPLVLLQLGDERGAERFLASIGRGKPRRARYRDVEIRTYSRGLTSAELDGFLALGPVRAVRSAIDAETGKLDSLSSSAQADAVRDELPDNRLADVYVSGDGIPRLLAGRGGLAAQLDTFTDFGASRGIAAAAVAHQDGVEVQIDSALDPDKVKAQPGFFAAFPSFEPSLAGEFASDTLLYLGIADPGETVRLLLDQANAAAPGVVGAFDRFNRSLRRRGGVDLQKGIFRLLDGEAAIGVAEARPVPFATLVVKDVDEDRARREMAQLQAPIVAALNPARSGQAPTFGQRKFGDVVARNVRISPSLDLAYAIFDGKLVVSTDPAGVRQAVEGGDDLGSQDSYQTVTSSASSGTSALVFLNLEGLVKRAVPLGLNEIVGGFSTDIAKLRALGLTVSSSEDRLNTTLFLEID
jgi:hypothetical protein